MSLIDAVSIVLRVLIILYPSLIVIFLVLLPGPPPVASVQSSPGPGYVRSRSQSPSSRQVLKFTALGSLCLLYHDAFAVYPGDQLLEGLEGEGAVSDKL